MSAKPAPQPTPDTQPYWDGAAAEQLWIQHCTACSQHFFYPRMVCPHCGSPDVAWTRASGRATLHSYVINHVPAPGFEDEVPYPIAVVQLEEGPRMMTTVIDVEPTPNALVLDMELEVAFRPRGELKLPVFRPVGRLS